MAIMYLSTTIASVHVKTNKSFAKDTRNSQYPSHSTKGLQKEIDMQYRSTKEAPGAKLVI